MSSKNPMMPFLLTATSLFKLYRGMSHLHSLLVQSCFFLFGLVWFQDSSQWVRTKYSFDFDATENHIFFTLENCIIINFGDWHLCTLKYKIYWMCKQQNVSYLTSKVNIHLWEIKCNDKWVSWMRSWPNKS